MEKKMEEVKAIRLKIKNTFEYVTNKKIMVYTYYIKYVEKNKKNNFFGLDSFHFQNKLIELEYDNMKKMYNFIDNRIYCDYYKLFGLIIQFFKKNFKQDKYETLIKNNSYPTYKDLEPYKVYDFDIVNDIHSDIIILINHLYISVNKTNAEINKDKEKMKNGLNIENYLHNYIYTNLLLETNINLFENYLKSYHKCHSKFLNNLKEKMLNMSIQLDNDVKNELNENENETNNINDVSHNEVIEKVENELIHNEVISHYEVIEQVENEVIEQVSHNEVIEQVENELIHNEVIEKVSQNEVIEQVSQNEVIEKVSQNEVIEQVENKLIHNEVINPDINKKKKKKKK